MLAVNARFLTQPLTGCQRYAYEISRRLPSSDLYTPGPPAPDYRGGLSHHAVHSGGRRGCSSLAGHLWEQLELARVASNRMMWSPVSTGPALRRRQAITIHDTACIECPQWYGARFAYTYRALWRVLIPRAEVVFTVSEFSKQRILDLYRVPSGRVVVTPPAVGCGFRRLSEPELQAALQRLGVIPPYVLSVGDPCARKNSPRMLRVWNRFAGRHPELELVIAGALGWRNSSPVEPSKRVKVLGHVAEQDLVALYGGATLLLFPSLYEGFGIPILEAMACGTPVLTSEATAMPEAAGGAALLVNPHDEESILDGLERLTASADLRQRLARAGLERLRRLSWDEAAGIVWRCLS